MDKKNYFTAGQFAKLHRVSKQTILFYEKIGLLFPAYIDPKNGYRYYAPSQLELLDSIFILKEIGVPLEKIKSYLKNRSTQTAITMLAEQSRLLKDKIETMSRIYTRLNTKYQIVCSAGQLKPHTGVDYQEEKSVYIFTQPVASPGDLLQTDIAIKALLNKLTEKRLDYNYQIGVTVPKAYLEKGEFVIADKVYSRLYEKVAEKACLIKPKGLYGVFYHKGAYRKASESYAWALKQIYADGYKIISDSYEDCIIDNLSAGQEQDYLTRISIKVSK